MSTARQTQSVKENKGRKEFKQIDKLFMSIEKDKSLPTFGQHFVQCMIFGIEEQVNLKKMYPKLYTRVGKWFDEHNRNIIAHKK